MFGIDNTFQYLANIFTFTCDRIYKINKSFV